MIIKNEYPRALLPASRQGSGIEVSTADNKTTYKILQCFSFT